MITDTQPIVPPQSSNTVDADNSIIQFQKRSNVIGGLMLVITLTLIAIPTYLIIDMDLANQRPEIVWFFGVVVFLHSLVGIIFLLVQINGFSSVLRQRNILNQFVVDHRRRSDEMYIAAQIARDASSGTQLDEILQRAVDQLTARFQYHHAAIYLIEPAPNGKIAHLSAVSGSEGSHQMRLKNHHIMVGSQSIIGYVTETGRARAVLDVRQDDTYMPNPHLPFTRSEMAVPLRVNDVVIGALDVQSRVVGAFSPDDTEILQTLADLIAVSINKTNLTSAVRTYAGGLQKLVDERTRELAIERAQLNAILEAMVEGVLYYESDKPIYNNHAFKDLLGYDVQNWRGFRTILRTNGKSVTQVDNERLNIVQHVRTHGLWRGELRLRRADGSEFDALATGVAIRPNEKEGFVIILRDISREKDLQEQQTRFVAYASHELRTPLANLKTRLYLMSRQPQHFEKHYEITLDVVNRMQRLVDDLLVKSRLERGLIELRREILPLQPVITKVVELQRGEAEKKQISLDMNLPETPLYSFIDADRITQVVTNLVSNAINYTDNGGKVQVNLSQIDDLYLEIDVTDTGMGIAPTLLEQVFHPFIRGENVTVNGTGLGLNIAKQIIDMHNGMISVKSEVDAGSTFTVRLQLMAQKNT